MDSFQNIKNKISVTMNVTSTTDKWCSNVESLRMNNQINTIHLHGETVKNI